MEITYQDQRKFKATNVDTDLDTIYILAEKAGIPEGTEVRIRIRNENGPYGYTKKISENVYRVVINIRNSKPWLTESAQYVVNNTLLHELRHVAQGQESGWQTLSGDYNGWSETEAREYGRTIKGQSEFFALK
jgi:hypothetical protein